MHNMDKKPKIARIEIDRETCISVASCVEISPDNFELDDDGKARTKSTEGNQETILEAAKSCPVDAIKLFDEEGKQIWPPQKTS